MVAFREWRLSISSVPGSFLFKAVKPGDKVLVDLSHKMPLNSINGENKEHIHSVVLLRVRWNVSAFVD